MLFRWLVNALALLAITQILPGFTVETFYFALIAALFIGFMNAVARPALALLTFPITIMTLGLSVFAINALLLWFVSSFLEGFAIDNFLTAIAAAILLWAVSVVTNWMIKQDKHNTK